MGAIRVSDTDLLEAAAQTRALHAANTSHSASPWGPFSSSSLRFRLSLSSCSREMSSATWGLLDEEVYLAQLALRARILNSAFQRKVLLAISEHTAAKDTTTDVTHFGEGCIAAAVLSEDNSALSCVPGKAHVMTCDFLKGKGIVELHAAEPKGIGRMREKLLDYARRNGAAWPLCAHILDPVRVSVVCSGAAQIVEAAHWFTDDEERTGLQVCRVKNGFAAQEEPDGFVFALCLRATSVKQTSTIAWYIPSSPGNL